MHDSTYCCLLLDHGHGHGHGHDYDDGYDDGYDYNYLTILPVGNRENKNIHPRYIYFNSSSTSYTTYHSLQSFGQLHVDSSGSQIPFPQGTQTVERTL